MTKSIKVSFPGSRGATLDARLETTIGPPRAYALFAHCFSCSKDSLAATRISRGLAERGIATLRFDFTGLGSSEGDFSNTNFSSSVEDLIAAADFLRADYDAPKILVGHSLGGAACIAAAPKIAGIEAVATLGAPADAEHLTEQFAADLDTIETEGEAQVSLAGRPFRIRRQLLDDIEDKRLDAIVGDLDAALLIAHSPIDEVVGVSNATRLFVAAKHPKSFLSLDDADHLLSKAGHAEHAARVIAAWAERYGAADPWPEPPEAEPGPRTAVVRETGRGRYDGWAVSGPHAFIVDEPESVGGLDAGPGPFQLLSAALAACTTMTLRMYAERKGMELGTIETRVVHDKDADAPADQPADLFSRSIHVEGDLDSQTRQKLLEIANKCPVHRTLERGSRVDSAWRD